ncbi:molybdenum cofactor biosynthesis protein MoaE [Novispirillum itersonii]|uniref:Molybdopterin synthase catalytic subunit n=1 Tax=Novispirillum itersonii TaxID=189 RepID=A0A7W9ZFW2_NOVIT|nr:molybdenum cofactor biosynthesis protein MoaE [Novispirillum itersonii]MBB6210757.1 molybdopterin synthase catalytic subunit [Novispirillum itersonii]
MIRVQTEDFDAGALLNGLMDDPAAGAVATFTGTVRDDSGTLTALTLEHYPGMTEKQLQALADEARRRWPLSAVVIVHRHGRLVPGDRIVFVGTRSAHRAAAFAACEFLMDWLKTRAPFWKQEQHGDSRSWVEAKSSDDTAADRWT